MTALTRDRSTPEEIVALEKIGLKFPPPRTAASFSRADASRRRRPLGLAPIVEPGDASNDIADGYLDPRQTAEKIVADTTAKLTATQLDAGVTWRQFLEHGLGMTVQTSLEDGDTTRKQLAKLRKEMADAQTKQAQEISALRAELSEARHLIRELTHIQETARIANRGERGIDGSRGVPGRDGRDGVGLQGPRGERGLKGDPAPRFAAFEPDPEAFSITPIYSTGEKGPPIALLSLFQAYDAAVSEIDDRDIAEVAKAQRARTEREA